MTTSLTPETAKALRRGELLHYGACWINYGKSGKAQPTVVSAVWRVNGQIQLWKTRPSDFRIPIKHGLYQSWEITQFNYHPFHREEDCDHQREANEWWERRRSENSSQATI